MKLQLPSSVSTKQDIEALVINVQTYASWYSKVSIKKRLKIKRTEDKPNISDSAGELIRDWLTQKPLSSNSLDELITALEDFKKTAPEINITLAAPAPNNLKKSLVSWCRENVAANILVNFQINSEILGGLVVRYGSHIFDWSFRRQILEAKGKFPEVLRRV